MVAFAEFVLMGNSVYDSVQTVNIGSYPHRFLFNARINLRNRFDLWIHALCVAVNFLHEVGEGLNSEVNPLSKIAIGKVSQLQVFLGIQTRLFFESCHRIVVEARPSVFPALEMRHPVRDVDVNSIDPSSGNLPHPLHVDLAPILRIRADPYILIAFSYPEGGAASKDRRLSCDLAL